MLAYLDHLEGRGELDLETATEFIVLIAALLELKSRLMLTGEEEELLDLEPGEAAEELLARMLDARRYRAAAGTCRSCSRARRACASAAPRCRAQLRRAIPARPTAPRTRTCSAQAIGRLLRAAADDQPAPHRRPARHASPSACRTCARCCAAGASASRRPSAAPTA